MKLKSIVVWLNLILLISCNKMCSSREAMTPEQVVQAYLDISLNMTDVNQKQELLKLTTGNLRSALEGASDQIITAAFVKQNFKLERYSVVERRDRTPRETEITFSLSYRNLGTDKSTPVESAPQTTTENTVSVVKREGAWYINDVLGKKTSIDFILGDEIKPAPGGSDPGPVDQDEPTTESSSGSAAPGEVKQP